MRKTILATSLALLFNTTVNYAETKIPKQTEVEKAYNKKMDDSQNTADKASKQLHVFFHYILKASYLISETTACQFQSG
jgi:hypothetical protein